MDQKPSIIIDHQAQLNIHIQSTQTNHNAQRYASLDNSFPKVQPNKIDQHDQTINQFIIPHIHQDIYQHNQSNIQGNSNANFQFQLHKQARQPSKNTLNLQSFAICLQSIEQSLTKVFYRCFHNKLISFYIQSLKEEQKKIKQIKQTEIKILKEQNWPFKQLFYKRYRNQNQQIMFEFVSMCAQKIQTIFKGYITHKRHKKASKNIQIFKSKLGAILIGWKTWNIYHCKKILQMRKNVSNLSKQIDAQIENPNLDRLKKMKKIEYLNSSQEVIKGNFIGQFNNLFVSGAWIYEVDKCFKRPLKKRQQNRTERSYFSSQQTLMEVQNEDRLQDDIKRVNHPKPITSKRQFQVDSNKQSIVNTSNITYQDRPIKKNAIPGNSAISTNYQSSQFQQRPIVAKGQYYLNQQDLKENQNQFLKPNQYQQQKQQNNQLNLQDSTPRVNKFRDEEKKKLHKRQKYDPRKAIEEEKKRLQEQKKNKIQIQTNLSSNIPQNTTPALKKKPQKKNNQVMKKTPRNSKKQEPKRQLQSPRESSKQKTVQKIKKQNKLTKKGDNSKSIKLITNQKKVQSKVNCWGSKKESSQNQYLANQESSYKSRYLVSLKQRQDTKIYEDSSYKQNDRSKRQIVEKKIAENNYQENQQTKNQAIKRNSQYQNKNADSEEEQTYQSTYLRRLVQEKGKGTLTYGAGRISGQKKLIHKATEHREESFAQKFQVLNNNIKNLSQNRSSLTNLKNLSQQRKTALHHNNPTQPQKRKQETHRSIESLQDVYSTQYTDRLNNLKNKLNMLESTRYIQRDDSIPILLEDSKFIKKMYKDHAFSSLYWPQVRTMETNFLDYIKFSSF